MVMVVVKVKEVVEIVETLEMVVAVEEEATRVLATSATTVRTPHCQQPCQQLRKKRPYLKLRRPAAPKHRQAAPKHRRRRQQLCCPTVLCWRPSAQMGRCSALHTAQQSRPKPRVCARRAWKSLPQAASAAWPSRAALAIDSSRRRGHVRCSRCQRCAWWTWMAEPERGEAPQC